MALSSYRHQLFWSTHALLFCPPHNPGGASSRSAFFQTCSICSCSSTSVEGGVDAMQSHESPRQYLWRLKVMDSTPAHAMSLCRLCSFVRTGYLHPQCWTAPAICRHQSRNFCRYQTRLSPQLKSFDPDWIRCPCRDVRKPEGTQASAKRDSRLVVCESRTTATVTPLRVARFTSTPPALKLSSLGWREIPGARSTAISSG